MNFSLSQIAIVLGVPLALAIVIWFSCRRSVRPGWVALSFALGAIICLPVARLGSILAGHCQELASHFYVEEFLEQFLSTAFPEEVGKGLAALLVLRLAGLPRSAAAWVTIGAASHCGFAALEGFFSALGNEGIWKVMIGRSLGSLSHCSWGALMMFFLWRGWQGAKGGRIANWSASVLVPVFLHSVNNAALVEVPTGEPEFVEVIIVLSSLAVLAVSVSAGGAVTVWAGFQFKRRHDVDRTVQIGVAA